VNKVGGGLDQPFSGRTSFLINKTLKQGGYNG